MDLEDQVSLVHPQDPVILWVLEYPEYLEYLVVLSVQLDLEYLVDLVLPEYLVVPVNL
jgi:hypothetical protein